MIFVTVSNCQNDATWPSTGRTADLQYTSFRVSEAPDAQMSKVVPVKVKRRLLFRSEVASGVLLFLLDGANSQLDETAIY